VYKITVKLKVSYVDPEDLQEVMKLLKPVLRNAKVAKNEQGKYKKAYIELETKI
jgi:predicted RNA-binding protein with EMAP domain